MIKAAAIGLAAVLAASAMAKPLGCTPRSVTARILEAPSPNATHPDWEGDYGTIGMNWRLLVNDAKKDQVTNGTGIYLRGDLAGPSGYVVSKSVFVLASQWKCGAREEGYLK